MAKRNPKFCSIIITHYHQDDERSETMQRSVMSLIENTRYPYELTIVDNGNSEADSLFILELVKMGKVNTYIRNAENMHFGYARNQGYAMSDGDYICIADNDIEYQEGWLTKCVQVLEAYPERKIYATPVYNVAHCSARFWNGEELDIEGQRYRINARAGSNCFVIRREDYKKIGFWKAHRVAGTKWTETAIKKGYMAAITPKLMIKDLGFRKGYNYKKFIPIKKTLSDGKEVYYNQDEFVKHNGGLHFIQQKNVGNNYS